ncbi:MAG: DUF2157 domain-containing protein [Chitinophagaceae bacterium]|nr:DUF2157 domain-containing protein [Chitinophagaceae bacterium]MCW5927339.1 DUF2157 domain-containing protein [Chitinophagaceae bacterium]
MKKITRDDIHTISRHSNWTETGIEKALKEFVYSDRGAWQKFLRMFLVTLGIGFSVSGIVFFFAYNWDGLNKYIKIGLIEMLIVAATVFVLFSKVNIVIRNITLTGAAMLVGVLFAVFGQIYQTGANAYDFFLGWTAFVTLWVLVANFAPLWLLYIILLNTTLILYAEQVAYSWSELFLSGLLFILNAGLLSGFMFFSRKNKQIVPGWFLHTLALWVAGLATYAIVIGIFKPGLMFWVVVLLMGIIYYAGIMTAIKERKIFYPAVISLSLVIIISALLLEISNDEAMFLFISLFIIGSITLVIKKLIDLQKKWSNENPGGN